MTTNAFVLECERSPNNGCVERYNLFKQRFWKRPRALGMATAVLGRTLSSFQSLKTSVCTGGDFCRPRERSTGSSGGGKEAQRLRIWAEATSNSSSAPSAAAAPSDAVAVGRNPSSTLFEAAAKGGSPSYPGGLGPHTGRDPTVKKPPWLRQRAPQGERYSEMKESLSTLKLNTVCEEAQCPNIGEVHFNTGKLYLFILHFT